MRRRAAVRAVTGRLQGNAGAGKHRVMRAEGYGAGRGLGSRRRRPTRAGPGRAVAWRAMRRGRGMTRRGRRWRVIAGLVAAGLLAAACGGTGGIRPATTVTAATSSSTATAPATTRPPSTTATSTSYHDDHGAPDDDLDGAPGHHDHDLPALVARGDRGRSAAGVGDRRLAGRAGGQCPGGAGPARRVLIRVQVHGEGGTGLASTDATSTGRGSWRAPWPGRTPTWSW